MTLYDIIAELRREHQTPSASKTLDMVVVELGQTRDNLRAALVRLDERPVPVGGRPVLEELAARARAEGIDDDQVPWTAEELRSSSEPVDGSQWGIALVLGGSAALIAALAIFVTVLGLNQIFHWH